MNALRVATWMDQRQIYWCDYDSQRKGGGGIAQIKPRGNRYKTILDSGIGRDGIRGLTVDWLAGQ